MRPDGSEKGRLVHVTIDTGRVGEFERTGGLPTEVGCGWHDAGMHGVRAWRWLISEYACKYGEI